MKRFSIKPIVPKKKEFTIKNKVTITKNDEFAETWKFMNDYINDTGLTINDAFWKVLTFGANAIIEGVEDA